MYPPPLQRPCLSGSEISEWSRRREGFGAAMVAAMKNPLEDINVVINIGNITQKSRQSATAQSSASRRRPGIMMSHSQTLEVRN